MVGRAWAASRSRRGLGSFLQYHRLVGVKCVIAERGGRGRGDRCGETLKLGAPGTGDPEPAIVLR